VACLWKWGIGELRKYFYNGGLRSDFYESRGEDGRLADALLGALSSLP
jgi:hypothetical protein